MDESKLRELAARVEISENIGRFAQSADSRDWEGLASLFTEVVYLDYSSLTGQEPDRKGARDLVEEWAAVLGNLDATQHFIGPPTVTIDGDEATAVAYFQAQHRLHNVTGGEKWTLGGRYDFAFELRGEDWKISGLTMTAMWGEGNQNIMALAASRRRPS
ncbi:MAG: nuclear transport factor 2 family protein [Rubrobacteraceae bacterium]|jgi:ketosteroid isomerase-like protein|nr:nuclear transport factor 2 family protein [Rubrobacteraceae bacterium]